MRCPLKAAALQFILAHPAFAAVIPGAASVAEVEENARMIETPIPAELWPELRSAGLLHTSRPRPQLTPALPNIRHPRDTARSRAPAPTRSCYGR